ncbi:hypothetical protein ACHAW6_010806, partial [Cyclotella cf. meneghiniana]
RNYNNPILNASCIAVVVFTPLAPVAITVVILVLTNHYMQIDMMIRCLSPLRTRSGAARFRSFGLNCASSQPKNLRSLSKRLPFAGYALLGVHRYFSKLNGKSNEVIDRSKFTHEVKICMPDLGEGEDVKGVIETWYKKKGDFIKKDDVLCDIETEASKRN